MRIYRYSLDSAAQLVTCCLSLQRVFKGVLQYRDHSVIKGHRDKVEQAKAFLKGTTKLKWPKGKHNKNPSKAVDVEPYPKDPPQEPITVDGKRWARYYYFAGFALGWARANGIKLRWGGDWDGDGQIKDQSFDDLYHFEVSP